MFINRMQLVSGLFFLILVGCSGLEESKREKIRKMNAVGEVIYRADSEILFPLSTPKRHLPEKYPWEDAYVGNHMRITKEFFRCKGSLVNPPQTEKNELGGFLLDCGGPTQHSLPLKEGKEFIYPALLDLLNYIQKKTQKKVILTCGHRCPAHNIYSDSSRFNRTSKHMIGAEVDFYVEGLEWEPTEVIALLNKYYQKHPRFKSDRRYTNFLRYDKQTNVMTSPWYNKEIFIKLFKKEEGRDQDNNHFFPYICIQLKWDRDEEKPVQYSWQKAFNGFLRY